MFEDEVAICVKTVDGAVLSFFISADAVKDVAGSEKAISVEVVDRDRDFSVVTLPRRSFEGSNVARVPFRSLVFA
ncbi:MAG TPA: hypothetical protein VNL91_04415 [Thermoanaerobaculia bacterium]|nr:hypothetical protein [Thermoanaerobaculia bacterium]